MAKFIKLKVNGRPCIYNVDHIMWVYDRDGDKIRIATVNGDVDEVEETFEEIESLLSANGEVDYSWENRPKDARN